MAKTHGPEGSKAPPIANALDDDLQRLLLGVPFTFGGEGYIGEGIMEPRAAIASIIQPTSVFEYGALYGYALMACLYGSPRSIARIGWCDNQSHTRHSNTACKHNLEYAKTKLRTTASLQYCETTLDSLQMTDWQPELVLIDGDHTETGCLLDTLAALQMRPEVLLFDDWITNHPGVEAVIYAIYRMLIRDHVDVHVRRVPTKNGIGVMTTNFRSMHKIATGLAAKRISLLDVTWGEYAA